MEKKPEAAHSVLLKSGPDLLNTPVGNRRSGSTAACVRAVFEDLVEQNPEQPRANVARGGQITAAVEG